MRVLLVEDEPLARQRAAGLLARLGHEVVPAEDGLQGWDLWQQSGYDVVLTHWPLPGMDRPQPCRPIRAARPPLPSAWRISRPASDRC